ncbi:MAG: 3-oxoacyl-ACP reductase family protein [bacterium]|nr:3-oxoacyl-ACP reductase family protein [bacterium]
MQLKGRVAVVTGGASGMGESICRLFAREGAKVVIFDANAGRARQVQASITADGGSALALPGDVARDDDNRRAVALAEEELGGLDVFVSCASFAPVTAMEDMTEPEWDRVMDVCLKGVFWGSRAAALSMRKRKRGRIVHIASMVGKAGAIVAGMHYSAAKAGVIVLTKCFAKLLAADGINVTCVAPGPTMTPMLAAFTPDQQEQMRKAIPLGRFGRPEDVARAVLFLVGESGDYITGEVLDVNGGLIMD